MAEKPRYWLVKSEPSAYSWADLVRDGKTAWNPRSQEAEEVDDQIGEWYQS
ncbi:MAG: EVE domain-containing protein, partial [bacterium]